MVGQTGASILYATVDREVMPRGDAECCGRAEARHYRHRGIERVVPDALRQSQKRCDKREETGTVAVMPKRRCATRAFPWPGRARLRPRNGTTRAPRG